MDVVLCDLPFGKQWGCVEQNLDLYPRFACFLERVLSLEGRFVLLTSLDQADFLSRCLVEVDQHEQRQALIISERRSVSLGFLEACIVVGRRGTSSTPGGVPPLQTRLSWENRGGRAGWSQDRLAQRPALRPAGAAE